MTILLAAPTSAAQPRPAGGQNTTLVYIGTYTGEKSKGIYRLHLDLKTDHLSAPHLVAQTTHPTFLTIHPSRRFLYAVNEVGSFANQPTGSVSAFAIDPATGNLTPLNQQPSGGRGPCHVTTDPAGKYVLVANYGGGSVASLPIASDGRLLPPVSIRQHQGKGPNPRRQEAPHAHSINLSPDGCYAFAADLGLDKLLVYRFDASKGSLTPHEPPAANLAPGAGPRHFAFHPNGRFAYVINELLNTVTAFSYDPSRGALAQLQTLPTLPADFQGENTTAEVQVHPSGQFLYGSNRGHNSIAIFRINPQTGQLTALGHESTQGKTPRNFGIDPTGQFLLAANQGSDSLVLFRINPQTGRLTPTGTVANVPIPVCVKFLQLER